MDEIVLGGGCFWCIEGGMKGIRGIMELESGYSGGAVPNPSYEQICGKKTGHAEVVKISFDPDILRLQDILDVFFTLHDPTQIDRQGNDVGPQYRSCIFYTNENQRTIAQDAIEKAAELYENEIVTMLEEIDIFWPAEEYHQDYFKRNPNQPYCMFSVAPKVIKARKKHSILYV
ncbi:MAG: peptide-methionine (S)-S-oxide reductase [Euryarchaeota archaeon]|nr:peptide-methionine (S)-S-oxide reductase [Euryarchaeota archaeon]RPG70995.1 MAG: peptide-methionine (S)-S-oxide reductase [Euryarchaeota archaeon TMED192]|tara:strand:- start:1373 stop:1894 length:522 start_codon:yes stop_codon:yes gene_type:complete